MPKITELTSFSGTLSDTDVFPVVNASLTKKVALSTLKSNVLSGGSVGETQLATGAVTSTKLGDAAVINAKIQDGTIAPAKLATQGGLISGSYGSATTIPSITLNSQGLVISAASVNVSVFPVGSLILFSTTTPPSGWRICDGTELTTSQDDAALLAFLTAANNPFGVGANSRPRVPNLASHYPTATTISHLIKL